MATTRSAETPKGQLVLLTPSRFGGLEPSRGSLTVIMTIMAHCFDVLRLRARLPVQALLGIAFWAWRKGEALSRRHRHGGHERLGGEPMQRSNSMGGGSV